MQTTCTSLVQETHFHNQIPSQPLLFLSQGHRIPSSVHTPSTTPDGPVSSHRAPPQPTQSTYTYHHQRWSLLQAYCDQFAPTWTELNRLLVMNLGPADHYRLSTHLEGEGHLRRPGCTNLPENAQYTTLFTALEAPWKKLLPKRSTSCKQSKNKSVAEFSCLNAESSHQT